MRTIQRIFICKNLKELEDGHLKTIKICKNKYVFFLINGEKKKKSYQKTI